MVEGGGQFRRRPDHWQAQIYWDIRWTSISSPRVWIPSSMTSSRYLQIKKSILAQMRALTRRKCTKLSLMSPALAMSTTMLVLSSSMSRVKHHGMPHSLLSLSQNYRLLRKEWTCNQDGLNLHSEKRNDVIVGNTKSIPPAPIRFSNHSNSHGLLLYPSVSLVG